MIDELIARPVRSTAGLVAATLVFGMLFYHFTEGWNLLDSLYFCVITLTTIGYGDYTPTTNIGKLFTIVYAFAGIGILATFIQLRAAKRLGAGMVNKVESGVSEVEHILHDEVLPHDPL